MSHNGFDSVAINGHVHGKRSQKARRPKNRWIGITRDDCDRMSVDLYHTSARLADDKGFWIKCRRLTEAYRVSTGHANKAINHAK